MLGKDREGRLLCFRQLVLVQARPDVEAPGFRQLPLERKLRFSSHAWHIEVDPSTGKGWKSMP